MNRLKKLIVISCITTTVMSNPFTVSVKAYSNNLTPNTFSSAYNNDNIFTTCGYKGQCTWFTYGRVLEKLDTKLPKEFYGNAVDWWYSNLSKNDYPYGTEPKANSIAVWSGGNSGYGHVAFVEKVEGNTVYFNEGNFSVRRDYDKQLKSLSKENMKKRGNLYLKGYIYLENNDEPEHISSITEKYKYGTPKINRGSALNIRSNPSTSSKICGTLKSGDIFTILSKVGDWYKIKINATYGYVSSKYVTLTSKTPSSTKPIVDNKKYGTPKINKGSALNIRSNPSISSKVCGTLKSGDIFTILSKVGDWYKIKINATYGYVSSKYVTLISKTPSSTKPIVDNKKYGTVSLNNKNSRLNFRTSPSKKAKIMTSLPNGTKVQILGNTNGWYKVNYNGLTGYLSSQLVKVL